MSYRWLAASCMCTRGHKPPNTKKLCPFSLSLSIYSLSQSRRSHVLRELLAVSWLSSVVILYRREGGMGTRSSLSIKAGLLDSDMDGIAATSRNAGRHLAEMVIVGSVSVSILRWLASIAAIYLLVLDRTNWRTNILTGLLVPYIFLNLPSVIFNIFRGEIGRWIAFIAIVLRLFFPRHFPDWLELPGALILLLVAAPSLLANDLRASVVGYVISLLIGVYLLQEHIRAAGGFRKALSERHGISNTIGIILLFVSPLWELIKWFL